MSRPVRPWTARDMPRPSAPHGAAVLARLARAGEDTGRDCARAEVVAVEVPAGWGDPPATG